MSKKTAPRVLRWLIGIPAVIAVLLVLARSWFGLGIRLISIRIAKRQMFPFVGLANWRGRTSHLAGRQKRTTGAYALALTHFGHPLERRERAQIG